MLAVVGLAAGCLVTKKPLHYLSQERIAEYKLAATEVAEPIDCTPIEIVSPLEPRRLRAPRKDELWDMPLAEAIHAALANATVIREDARFLSRENTVVRTPNLAPSIFDPALQQSEVGFNRGVEAALADFDARFTTQMLWGRAEQVQNNAFVAGGIAPGGELVEQTGDFSSSLQKRTADGSTLTLQHDWDYNWNNRPNQLFDSSYRGFVGAAYRTPLWAGSGTEFTRVSGPFQGDNQINVDQGVVIARINEDVAIADFEADIRDLLRDVEEVYWNLSLAYHTYDSEVVARNNALRTWRTVDARRANQLAGAGEEAQARDTYYDAKARAENALADLYEGETRLRRLLGLAVNDGRVIRPSDDPVTAEVELDWQASLVTALIERVEIRRQKFEIRSLELQRRAACSLVNPRLDFVSEYRVNGFGDRLLFDDDDDGITEQGFANAYETITQGNQTSWTLGFEFSLPIGQRRALARVRNVDLRLARARAGLAALELEIGHELSIAFQRVDRSLVTAKSNFARWHAAKEREAAFEQQYRFARGSVDDLLRAQTSVAQAKTAYFSSLVQYNQALAELHYRAGTLLAHNRVHLAEGDWCPEAYDLAIRRAVARAHSIEAGNLLHAEPEPIATPHEPLMRAPLVPLEECPPLAPGGGAFVPPAPPAEGLDPDAGPVQPLPTPGEAPAPLERDRDNFTLAVPKVAVPMVAVPSPSAPADEPTIVPVENAVPVDVPLPAGAWSKRTRVAAPPEEPAPPTSEGWTPTPSATLDTPAVLPPAVEPGSPPGVARIRARASRMHTISPDRLDRLADSTSG